MWPAQLGSPQGAASLQQPAVREHAFRTSPIGTSGTAAAGVDSIVPVVMTIAAKAMTSIHDFFRRAKLNIVVS
jgi:hypothetical protein